MDYDRKSTVSSFYGGRKSSVDALTDFPSSNQPYNPPQPLARVRHDSASSFYNPNGPSRASVEMLNQPQSAGYNRNSYFDTGREEPIKPGFDEESNAIRDDGFDVFADFNNVGPRYSTAFGSQQNAGYRQVPSPAPVKLEDQESTTGPVEMVTVPALGPEWKASELRDLKGKGKKEANREDMARKWKEWRRGERGLCGRYFTRKFTVWFLFALCCAIGLILVFTIPRVPGFNFNSATPLIPATGNFNKSIPILFSRFPANFSYPALADLQLDTGSNYLPLKFSKIHADVYDLDTGRHVASGDMGSTTVPAKSFPRLQVPLNFTYVATNTSDQTWANMYNACRNKAAYADGTRPPIAFKLLLDFTISGLIGHHIAGTQVTDAPCPVELALNAG